MQKDNSTFNEKIAIRRVVMRAATGPWVVMETHGGIGAVFDACYRDVSSGVVFEKKPARTDVLAQNRPTWAVYEADCVAAIAAGVGAHLEVNLLDVDSYGDPWPVIDAFFRSERPRAKVLWVVVNDGLRQKIRISAWLASSVKDAVLRYGNTKINSIYLQVCEELLTEKAKIAGYQILRFRGYYCGCGQQMTHYMAELRHDGVAAPGVNVATGVSARSQRHGAQYRAYYDSAKWSALRDQRLQHANHRCERCGDANSNLHIHHETYDRLGDELLDDLRALCGMCHKLRHIERPDLRPPDGWTPKKSIRV